VALSGKKSPAAGLGQNWLSAGGLFGSARLGYENQPYISGI